MLESQKEMQIAICNQARDMNKIFKEKKIQYWPYKQKSN